MLEQDNKFVCINLMIRIWSGQKSLTAKDLQREGVDDGNVIKLGSKKIFDPQILKSFLMIRRQAERYCQSKGIRFLEGYAIPEDKAAEVTAYLKELQERFNTEKKDLLSIYDKTCQDWIKSIPDQWKPVVQGSLEPRHKVANALSFSFQAFKVVGIDGIGSDFSKTVGGLGDQLTREIAEEAKKIYEQSFNGRSKVSQKALRPIRTLMHKADGLSFLEPKVGSIVGEMALTLNALPKRGFIEGRDKMSLIGLLDTLFNLDRVAEAHLETFDEADEVSIEEVVQVSGAPDAWF